MKKAILSMVTGVTLLAGGSALAIQYIDTNPADTRLDANYFYGLNPLYNPSYTGGWDLLNEGYDPLTEQINSAVATFKLNDANGFSESYTITIDGNAFLTGGSFSTTLLGTISVGDSVGGTALVTLDATGLLSYTVTANSGVFWLKEATLTAEASGRPQTDPTTVPDGGASLALLGMGLIGLGALKRKLS